MGDNSYNQDDESHNDFSFDLDDYKHKNGVVIDFFCTDMIGHPRSMFLN